MGLNLEISRVVFSTIEKYDGIQERASFRESACVRACVRACMRADGWTG